MFDDYSIAIVERVTRLLARMAERADNDEIAIIEAMRLHIQHGADLDAALGLNNGWRQHVQRRQQMIALAALIAAVSPPPSCRHVARLVVAYARSAWLRDHARGRRPSGLKGHAYDYLASGGAVGVDSIRRLAAEVRGNDGRDIAQRSDAA